jgi:hypothetical protein
VGAGEVVEGLAGLTVYFVVMRVYGRVSGDGDEGEGREGGKGGGRGTVVGRACRRSADWPSHSWAVAR